MFKRKIISVLLTAVLVLTIPPFGFGAAFAEAGEAGTLVDGLETMATNFEERQQEIQAVIDSGGFFAEIGTADPNAIQISTAQELYNIRNNLSGSYVLAADIDLSGYSGGEWIPIGNGGNDAFAGTFDGQGHVISNLKIIGNKNRGGLFGFTSGAAIKNVGLEGISIDLSELTVDAFVGGLIGYAHDTVTVSNCYNTGEVSAVLINSPNYVYVGGIIGSASGSVTVNDCYNTGDVSGSGSHGDVGGIIGDISGSVTVSNCYNTGEVSASVDYTGGIVGRASGSVAVSDCYNTGYVSASDPDRYDSYEFSAGGIIGVAFNAVDVNNCHNTGDVSASVSDSVSYPADFVMAGGIVGYSLVNSASDYESLTVSNCWNTGDISSFDSTNSDSGTDCYAGGIVGGIESYRCPTVISNCCNTGFVFASGSYSGAAGGIVGYCAVDENSGSVVVRNGYNTGDVSASIASSLSSTPFAWAGGIVGNGNSTGQGSIVIGNCYSTGDISAYSAFFASAGGILGGAFISTDIIYPNASVAISGCVTLSGGVSATSAGGNSKNAHMYMICYVNNANVTDVTNVTKTNNLAIEGPIEGNPIDDTGNGLGGARISLAQAKQQSTYENLGWDFDAVWEMVPGYDLPQLQWQAEYTNGYNDNDNGGNDGDDEDNNNDGNNNENGGDENNGNNDNNGDNNTGGNDNNTGGGSYTGGSGGSSGGTAEKTNEATEEKPETDAENTTSENATPTQFSDTASHWAAEAISFVVSEGLFNGVSETEFAPNAPMTRAMFATVLSRYAGGTATGTASFGDVPAGKWYTDGVLWAAENGIVSGTGGGLFDPDGNITREQLAVMLYNYAKFAGLDVSGLSGLDDFADSADISEWATEALKWAVASGLISGKPGGLLDSKGPATRAEVATILQRFITGQ